MVSNTRSTTNSRSYATTTTAALLSLLLLSSGGSAFTSSPSSLPQSCASNHCSNNHRPIITTSSSSSSSSSSHLGAAFIDENYPNAPKPTPTNDIHREETIEPRTRKPPKTLPNGGSITLVGAGPGSPDLLTVAAYKIITDPANFLIVDRLVSKEILDLIEGEYRIANKVPGCQGVAQDEIFAWCKEGLEGGRSVVRLKIGESRFCFYAVGEVCLCVLACGMVRSIIVCRENERPMSKRSKRRALMNNSVRALAMNERNRGGIATRTNERRRGARRNVQRRSPTGTARSPDCAALCGNPPRTLVRRAKRSAEYHCHATGFGRSSDRIRCTRR
mmetsp:Transcript_19504/g.30664  ORF Transcript_19504/g.30664 Transcript_19504/m.30664 type:complete len:332 (-) Transcript_19504:127-1122(-)